MQLFDSVRLSLERALEGASMRQSALSENLANVNTPGYKRQDVDFQGALQAAMPFGKDAIEAVPFQIQTDDSSPVRADGNSVDADVEGAQLAQNALEYEAIAKVISARDDILRSAMGAT